MKEASQKLLDKAFRSIQTAEHLLHSQDIEFVAGRAYYAMFYAAEALLFEKGLAFRKHSGVHSAFAQNFIQPGIFQPHFHQWLLEAFDKRITSDYEVDASLNLEEAKIIIDRSKEFLEAVRKYLG
ncbi:MAG: HEPN domain-containing protein [Candidatus Omnitrophica bacterium]|nr:HEPN domain-containing protein [Candidatus Omnitrophota bacterium]